MQAINRVIFIVAFVIVGGFLISTLLMRPAVAPQVQGPDKAPVSHWDRPAPTPEGAPLEHAEGGPDAAAEEEDTVTRPVAYFPPPTQDLSGGKLGAQVVPGTDEIGDVFTTSFHLPTQTLFMAVVERDGMRAVWALRENGAVERVFVLNADPGDLQINVDSKGVIYVQQDNPARMYRSDDGLKTWRLVADDLPGMFWSIADDGDKELWASMHAYSEATLWHSPDNGFSWERQVDFKKVFPADAVPYAQGDNRDRLRHLHDVFYSAKLDALFVGTGDVARYGLRSDDRGKTWKKVWDEGFTAHAVVAGGDKFLLAPDQLNSHGLALYDGARRTVREVWNPIAHGWAGYSYSVINAEGVYYAAFHTEANEESAVVPKFGVIVSPDAVNWYPFLEWGPLGHHARTNIWLTPADKRVYASVNGRLYAFAPLEQAWFKGREKFAAPATGNR